MRFSEHSLVLRKLQHFLGSEGPIATIYPLLSTSRKGADALGLVTSLRFSEGTDSFTPKLLVELSQFLFSVMALLASDLKRILRVA
jgi:hypothetical protein